MARPGMQITEIVDGVHRGEILPSDVADAFLGQIEQYDDAVKAFATVDPEMVKAEAAVLDRKAERGGKLLLHGVPLGVKDIIDVAGLPTKAGFVPYENRIATKDAAIVSALRSLGTFVIGKTHTTQFAAGDPAPTRNPWNPAKSPAGSSAGSGAALPSGMAALTLGTQTAGSVLRPAAFNGTIGFKPSFDWFSIEGVLPAVWSLDHIGYYGATVADVARVYDSLIYGEARPVQPNDRPRIGLLTEYFDMSTPEVAAHVRGVAEKLEASGATVVEASFPEPYEYIISIRQVISSTESGAGHGQDIVRWEEHFDWKIVSSAQIGSLIPGTYRVHAMRLRRKLTAQVDQLLAGFDALILPTCSHTACDRDETGDRSLQVPATLFGVPSISLPTGISEEGLPFGTQLVSRRNSDRQLLDLAAWVTEIFPPIERPDLDKLKANVAANA